MSSLTRSILIIFTALAFAGCGPSTQDEIDAVVDDAIKMLESKDYHGYLNKYDHSVQILSSDPDWDPKRLDETVEYWSSNGAQELLADLRRARLHLPRIEEIESYRGPMLRAFYDDVQPEVYFHLKKIDDWATWKILSVY